ncbi:VOC family protein [Bacillus sp. DTU_2020_1000418_1_SI_GHA_SEK_038]|uniref:VOC family protein n=1 Tax=Bacillus sp. DTU_2020_1000418_1_SI_GHA_SEK_038 TaxID=3077585 RepID=UPI0028E8442C|nr:VOC family protein [Bacillus sp. DTU_2020_1000418_1_SI_GHA_SEK_038]WNS76250.1 VOC family protein [Bacillus sp. DTU_2020_1000418_1_SI_GHA_SEK_038]
MSFKFIPYLMMNGNAKEAIDFYEKVFNAEVLGILTFGQMPPNPEFPLPEEAKDLVSHATIKVGDSELMFSDTFPGQPHQIGNQVTICVTLSNPDQSHQIFESLQAGGQVGMPLQKTDFSPAYGVVTDKFGVTFQIYTENQ